MFLIDSARQAVPRGFTLLDVLLSILVMTIGFVGLSAMQVTALTAGARARELAEATQLSRSKVEEFMAVPLPLPPPPAGGEVLDARGCRVLGDTRRFCQDRMAGTQYTRTWTVAGTSPQPIRFTVTTTWRSSDGKNHSAVVSGER
jgi:type II secretory pathway pseudopilin PulG